MFGEYAPFIIASYAVTGIALGGLVLWTLGVWRARRRELSRLEEEGVSRRSGSRKEKT